MAVRGIFLIGASGTGKSTVAAILGERLGWPVFDLDRVIAERAGAGIPQIFEREGEDGFRRRETEALREVAQAPPFVVATGGGAPLRAENRAIMARTGWVVTLEGRPETLLARIQGHLAAAGAEAVRPLLNAEDPLERLRTIKERRQPLYALADWTVHTDRLSPEEVAAEVDRGCALLEGLATGDS